MPIKVSNSDHELNLTYIDDVVTAFLQELDLGSTRAAGFSLAPALPSQKITLGELITLLELFRDHRTTLLVPDFSRYFVRALYATFLSYLEPRDFAYTLHSKNDDRGSLAEFVKSPAFGQVFVSRTKPGITRGNHFHHTKVEKFLVMEGRALIRFRNILNDAEVIEHQVCGTEYRVLDIPPGYTHSIENIGTDELVTLFWASEIFDSDRPDTFSSKVLPEASSL